jgi:hypothetical protein
VDNQGMVYMAYDGDNAGRLCGRAVLADDPNALHEISARIRHGHEVVERWVEQHGGQFISGGGDEGVFAIPADAVNNIEELRQDYQFVTNLTTTVGIGSSLSEAGKAMLVGKFRGKNQVVHYDPSIETDLLRAEAKASSGAGSAEEKKISEAYLQPEGAEMKSEENNSNPSGHSDCPYCQKMSAEQFDDPSHCKYCHDSAPAGDDCPYCKPAASAAGDDCPYCKEGAAPTDDCPYCAGSGKHDSAAAGHPGDCPYCAKQVPDANGGTDQTVTPTDGPTVMSSTTTDSENYIGQDLNNPDSPKPEAIQHNPDGLGTSFDTPTVENTKLDAQGQGKTNEATNQESANPDPQSEETVQDIAQQIDALPPTYQQAAETQVQVDSANMATGTNMEDGVSRPEDFSDDNHPRDLGLAEGNEPPDVAALMQEGLDVHSEGINREKVVNLVSEALVGFKASKGILEKAKLQAPQLYESSIAMLKAMIEMCKMLGLDQDAGATDQDSQDPLGTGEMQDQPAEGSAPPAMAHTGEGQNPPGTLPQYAQKEDGSPVKK